MVAQVFDAWLKLWSLITKPEILDAMDDIEAELSTWQGVTIGLHKYGGMQFNYLGKELGHIHGNGILDMRFSRVEKRKLMEEQMVSDHHVFPDSGWITFYIQEKEDSDYAILLLKMAYYKKQRWV
nr:luciferase family protein [Mucilaginibacter rivuli]